MSTKVATKQDYFERPSVKTLHLIRKLRWIGMEGEAHELLTKIQETSPTGGIITIGHETD